MHLCVKLEGSVTNGAVAVDIKKKNKRNKIGKLKNYRSQNHEDTCTYSCHLATFVHKIRSSVTNGLTVREKVFLHDLQLCMTIFNFLKPFW